MLCSSLEVVGVPAGGLELLVNGTKGEVKVPLNTDVIVRVQGADPVDDIVITNISAFPEGTQNYQIGTYSGLTATAATV